MGMMAEEIEQWNVEEISDHGERVTPFLKDHVFYGHLSIYDFAAQFCKGAVVLDAGSGSGYGTAYLADGGAVYVQGIDNEAKAVAFSQTYFKRPNLAFQVMDLREICGFQDGSFDVIFTSNVLEHIPGVIAFFRQAWRLLKPEGTLVVAVPPITDRRLLYLNLINPYHVNLWTPRQWFAVLNQFFGEVTPYLHGVERLGEDFKPEHTMPSESGLNEKSFVFVPGSIEDMYKMFTLTSIFVVRSPRALAEIPLEDAPLTFVDESFTREVGYVDPDLLKELEAELGIPLASSTTAAADKKPILSYLLRRMHEVLRAKGIGGLFKEGAAFLKYHLRFLASR